MWAFVSLEFEILRFFGGRRKIEKIIMSLCWKALLVTKRELFLQAVTNSTASASYRWLASLALLNEPLEFKQHCWLIKRKYRNSTDYINMLDGFLSEYEEVCQIEHEWKLETRNPKIENIFQYQVCSEAVGAGVDLVSKEFSFNWDYVQSCFFSLTILTTIGLRLYPDPQDVWALPGYGNFAAETFGGRLFCLLFGMIGEKDLSKTKNKFWWNMFPPGIPLMLSVLADVGGLMAGGLEGAWWVLFFRRGPCLAWKK